MVRPCRACAYIILILLTLPGCLPHHAAAAQSEAVGEAELLLKIKHAWGDPPVLAAWNWSAATTAAGTHCRWPYVRCDT